MKQLESVASIRSVVSEVAEGIAIEKLAPMARSWLKPAELKVKDNGFSSEGYSRDQRAYILSSNVPGVDNVLRFELLGSEDSPLVNPAFVVRNWGNKDVALKINGRQIRRGKDFRFGHHRLLESTDLIIWINISSAKPLLIELAPSGS